MTGIKPFTKVAVFILIVAVIYQFYQAKEIRKFKEIVKLARIALNNKNTLHKFHIENLERGVPEHLLREIELADLTDEQVNRFFDENCFLKPSTLPYNLLGQSENKKYFSQEHQNKWFDKYLKQKTNGIFVEEGAIDGVSFSNTLFFKRQRNWTGLLREPNSNFYNRLATVHWKAYTVNICLSIDQKVGTVSFLTAEIIGGIEKLLEGPMMNRANKEYANARWEEVLCDPLFPILEGIGMTHIHLYSLDVEGAEIDILKTIPF